MARKQKKEADFEKSPIAMDDLRRKFPNQSDKILAEIYANGLLMAENLEAESPEPDGAPEPEPSEA